MNRLPQVILIASTLLGSWFGMQAVHELGHVIGAGISGGKVAKVVLHPLTISRTDLAENPVPLLVVWAGPIFGVIAPLVPWVIVAWLRFKGAFVMRFFAGFCLIANGTYIAAGSFQGIGDCGDMLRNGSPMWQLWLFGAITIPTGLWLWHKQGIHFGLGAARGQVNVAVAWWCFAGCAVLIAIALWVGGQ